MIKFFLVVVLASAAWSSSIPPQAGLAVAGGYHPTVAVAPYAVPAVSTVYDQVPTAGEASRVTSFETARSGVPHTVARVSGYAPAIHASLPTVVPGAVHPIPAYSYVPGYSQRHGADPLRYRYAYGVNPYGLGYRADTIGYVGFS